MQGHHRSSLCVRHIVSFRLMALKWRFPVRASAAESSDDRLSEEELLEHMAYVRVHS